MAKIRKSNKQGLTWQIDYYDPQGKRVMKGASLKAVQELLGYAHRPRST